MATKDIKKAIDDARDILVGKVPLPNDQVDQITLALLYKFMDDMDQVGIDMGGVPTFFAGEFEKYNWKKVMSNSLGAQARYNLYSEGLEKFYTNSALPETFRQIFKNATIPYRDPETLTNFLKVINESFDYNEDSEQLGDAYELLLNILGSSGDLGMFRTPRNIINFIVSLVEPNKEDKILDPACGTAGFLISAYKYVLSKNKDEKGKLLLSFDDNNKLLENINGYDIAPQMVKFSEMNLFLHGANEPKIFEYDTLTLDDRWEDKYDCILANPPFMTPKGGIAPHNKFSIKTKKAEVLFVDYIANHLTSQGKAGIIVPDGVAFGSEKAIVSVRKDLIENSLWGVISLPSGIFQPYAGVSTTILLLDKKIAKNNSNIIFAKLNNDGFSLDKKKNPIDKNDIPNLTKIFLDYKDGNMTENENIKIVSKDDVINNNYDLSVNKYVIGGVTPPPTYPPVEKIIETLDELEKSISVGMKELKSLLKI